MKINKQLNYDCKLYNYSIKYKLKIIASMNMNRNRMSSTIFIVNIYFVIKERKNLQFYLNGNNIYMSK